MGHFRVVKTLAVVKEHFYWPHLKKTVEVHCARCVVWKKAKYRVHPQWVILTIADPYITMGRNINGFCAGITKD